VGADDPGHRHYRRVKFSEALLRLIRSHRKTRI
jgi:hypothetical protein